MAYIQTEVLADCHLIFKVDGTGERYSSAPSHARCTPFLSVSMVPDHISPGNLILTFRTPHVIAPAISPRVPLLSFSLSFALSSVSLHPFALPLLSFSSLCKSYVAQNVTGINFPPELFLTEMPNGISCAGPIRFSIQFLIYYIFTFLLRPTTESLELRKNRALADESFRIFRGRR